MDELDYDDRLIFYKATKKINDRRVHIVEEYKEFIRKLEERDAEIQRLHNQCASLFSEVQTYRNAARLYGVDLRTMLMLAKSQIKTSADNIRLVEKIQEVFDLFRDIPENLSEGELNAALTVYDGDGSRPYCDLVYCGLSIIREYYKKRSEYDEWRRGNLPENF